MCVTKGLEKNRDLTFSVIWLAPLTFARARTRIVGGCASAYSRPLGLTPRLIPVPSSLVLLYGYGLHLGLSQTSRGCSSASLVLSQSHPRSHTVPMSLLWGHSLGTLGDGTRPLKSRFALKKIFECGVEMGFLGMRLGYIVYDTR